MGKKVSIIGSGFAGLAAAACCAKNGHDVTVYEKNHSIGGRARKFEVEGFTFDMGPSWYWMPDVFENFYQLFGHTASDFYQLDRLDPGYRVYFGKDDFVDIPAQLDDIYDLVESMEKGAALQLKKFLKEAAYKYDVGMNEFVFKPGLSVMEFADPRLISSALKLNMFSSISSYIRKHFKNPKLIQILEFPVLFLGAKPSETPAMYSLMNYADWSLGTWYPQGGMFKIIEAMEKICLEQGVKIETNAKVSSVNASGNQTTGISINGTTIQSDIVVAGADYHHVEQHLLEEKYRMYDEKYWDTRQLSPSCMIFYVGVKKKIAGLLHHTLFFDTDFDKHLGEIYDTKEWPSNPLFYVCTPSKTDDSVAPEGYENLFILIPVAVDLDDPEEVRKKYFNLVLERIEHITGESVKDDVIYHRSYAHRDYIQDYNGYKGNAFGLANTLSQTAILKPRMKNKHLKNLFFAGQLTTPGPGVPPSLISGQVVAAQIEKEFGQKR
ncbi:MAG: phytoene desaturase [Flavobacteriales bacterium]|nr:phytoene desaturase [Flavobacteriales bacterium]MCB9192168.1 phytoene desaturase [Flavobacteriales bacterium]MCB9203851.1 phytoene desaturase [Flavobacteriales bacterium]